MAKSQSVAPNGNGSGKKVIIIATIITAAATILVGWWQYKSRIKPVDPQINYVGPQIRGRVIDAVKGARIPNAKVSLEGQDLPSFVYTDSEGIFSVPLKKAIDNVRLVVEIDGYERYEKRVSISPNSDMEDIRLNPTRLKQNTFKVSIEKGGTASLFNGFLTITLNQVTKTQSVSGYGVTAVVDSVECEPLWLQNRGDGYKTTYNCKGTFDIEILKINKDSATFKVSKIS